VIDGHTALGVNGAHRPAAVEICAGATLGLDANFLPLALKLFVFPFGENLGSTTAGRSAVLLAAAPPGFPPAAAVPGRPPAAPPLAPVAASPLAPVAVPGVAPAAPPAWCS